MKNVSTVRVLVYHLLVHYDTVNLILVIPTVCTIGQTRYNYTVPGTLYTGIS